MSEKLIPTWKERLAHLDRPTDFAEAQAAKMEAAELRRYIRELESASQPGGGEVLARGWFHRSEDGDYEIHDESAFISGPECYVCVPCVIVAAPSAGNGGAEGA